MELKCLKSKPASEPAECSNRTFMELKSRGDGTHRIEALCSNRTFMELK